MNILGRNMSFKKYLFVSIIIKFICMCYMVDCMKYSISLSMLLYFNIVILFHNMVQAMKLRQDDKTNYFRPQRAPVF